MPTIRGYTSYSTTSGYMNYYKFQQRKTDTPMQFKIFFIKEKIYFRIDF